MKSPYDIYSNYLFAKAESKGIPLSGTFELTARCNLDCKMCYIHRRANDSLALKQEKSAAEWLALAEECCKAGTLQLLLTGGEPLLRPDFREIYLGCRQLGMMVSINTNATLITDEMIDFLTENPPARINITLYGASPETYGRLCGDPDAYHKVKKAILSLNERGILVKLNFSVTPYNMQDAAAVYAFAKEQNIFLQAATYMFPPIRACELSGCQADRLSPETSAQAQMEYDRCRFSPEKLYKRWTNQCSGIRVEEPGDECQELPKEHISCRAGSTTYWVTWDGKLRPCGMMTAPGTDLKPGHFSEAWKSFRDLCMEIPVPAKCTGCEMRHICDQCPAVCQAETGSFSQAPEYMCQRTRAYLKLIQQELRKSRAGKTQLNGAVLPNGGK